MKTVKKMFAVLMSVLLLQGQALATNTSSGISEEDIKSAIVEIQQNPELYASVYKENKEQLEAELGLSLGDELSEEQLQTLLELDVEDTETMSKIYAAVDERTQLAGAFDGDYPIAGGFALIIGGGAILFLFANLYM